MHRSVRIITTFFLGNLLLLACKQPTAESDTSQDQSPTSEVDASLLDGSNRRVGPDEGKSRGLSADFDFSSEFPQIYSLLRQEDQIDGNVLMPLSDYAQRVVTQSGLNGESDLVTLFNYRDETIIPRLAPYFENNNEQILRQYDRYEQELNRLGMSANTAEGMITGIGPAPMLEDKVAELSSPAFQAYQRFLNAENASQNGEYPFMDMAPFEEMVLAGEELFSLLPNPYWEEIEPSYERALSSLTDLHVVQSPNQRGGEGTPLVGGLNTDFYPYAAETGRLEDFATRHPSSKLAQAVQRIAQNPSQISDRPEHVYVIVLEWTEVEEIAQRRIRQHLRSGMDIPHNLPVVRGNGKTQYAVSYRFYEDADLADAALTRIEQQYPDAELIFCSVKDHVLYQLGPSAN